MRNASLTIRNIPGHVLVRLRERAERHRRSMQGEVLSILESAVAEPVVRLGPRELLERVRKLGISSPSEAADIIRKDRDGGHRR